MKIGMVLLGEAGNYGDDLILLAVLHSIGKYDPATEVSFLSFGNRIPLNDAGAYLKIPDKVTRARSTRDLPMSSFLRDQFTHVDVMLVGGGGLLQTSQHPTKPFQWLRHIPNTSAYVVGIGLGIGPLNQRWRKYFKRQPSPFDYLYVREDYSFELASGFGWEPNLSTDFIDKHFIDELTSKLPKQESDNSLGVALRAWPSLTAQGVAEHIRTVADQQGLREVRYFILESKNGKGPDVDFSQEVAKHVGLPTKGFHVYKSDNLLEFTHAMYLPAAAVSMKLHSSAVWGARNIPIYPIIYAPKISDYFGLPYSGTQLVEDPIPPAPPLTGLRSEEALLCTLTDIGRTDLTDDTNARKLFSARQRLQFQTHGLLVNTLNKVKAILKN